MKTFEQACKNVGLPITKRQLAKWRNKRGLAFAMKDMKFEGSDTERYEKAKAVRNKINESH